MSDLTERTLHLYYVNPWVAHQDADLLGLKARLFNGHWVEAKDKQGGVSKRKKKVAAIIEGPEAYIDERSFGLNGEQLLHYDDVEATWS